LVNYQSSPGSIGRANFYAYLMKRSRLFAQHVMPRRYVVRLTLAPTRWEAHAQLATAPK